MLQPGAANIAAALPEPVDTWRAEVPPILSTSRWTRPLVWSALAAAAAIMIMMFSPPDAQKKVAMAPAPQDVAGAAADQRLEAHAPQAATKHEALATDGAPAKSRPMVASNRAAAQAPSGDAGGAPGGSGNGSVASPAVAAPHSTQNGFYAGPAPISQGTGGRGAAADQFNVSGDDGPAVTLLVVRCDVTPEVARSASFRKLLAEQQIPWQEERNATTPSDGQSLFATPHKALAGAKEASKPAADTPGAEKASVGKLATGKTAASKAIRSDKTPVVEKAEVGKNGVKSEAERIQSAPVIAATPAADATAQPPSNTEAVYVVASPAQVEATIAAIAGSGEYRNVQMTELGGPLPVELFSGVRETSDRTPESGAAPDIAAHSNLADGESLGAERTFEGLPEAGPEQQSVVSSPPAPAGAVATPAPQPSADVPPPKSADSAKPAVTDSKDQAPSPLDNESSRGEAPAPSPGKPSAHSLRQNVSAMSSPSAQPAIPSAAPAPLSVETIAELSRAVSEMAGEDKEGVSQKDIEANRSEGQANGKKVQAQNQQRQFSASDDNGKRRAVPMLAPAAPKPQVLEPTAAPRLGSAAPADEAASSEKALAHGKLKQSPAAMAQESRAQSKGSETRDDKQQGVIAGGGQGQASDLGREHDQDAAQAQSSVSPRRAIFLFRVIPAPTATSEP
jgi:hypothetical protein